MSHTSRSRSRSRHKKKRRRSVSSVTEYDDFDADLDVDIEYDVDDDITDPSDYDDDDDIIDDNASMGSVTQLLSHVSDDKDHPEWNVWEENSTELRQYVIRRLMDVPIALYVLPLRQSRNHAEMHKLSFKGWQPHQITSTRTLFLIKDLVQVQEKYKFKQGEWEIWLKKRKYNFKQDCFYSDKTVVKRLDGGEIMNWLTPRDLDCKFGIVWIDVMHPTKTKQNLLTQTTTPHPKISSQSKSKYKQRPGSKASERNKNVTMQKAKWLRDFTDYIKSNASYRDVEVYMKEHPNILHSISQSAVFNPNFTFAMGIKRLRARIKPHTTNSNTNNSLNEHKHRISRDKVRITKRNLNDLNIMQPHISEEDLERAPTMEVHTEVKENDTPIAPIESIHSQIQIESLSLKQRVSELESTVREMNRFIQAMKRNQTIMYICLNSEIKSNRHDVSLQQLHDTFQSFTFDIDLLRSIKNKRKSQSGRQIKKENESIQNASSRSRQVRSNQTQHNQMNDDIIDVSSDIAYQHSMQKLTQNTPVSQPLRHDQSRHQRSDILSLQPHLSPVLPQTSHANTRTENLTYTQTQIPSSSQVHQRMSMTQQLKLLEEFHADLQAHLAEQ
eukprot:172343_1